MNYIPQVMLDSGAYSAWRHKGEIDLDAYINFIEEHGSRFYSIVALDRIPGEKARMARTSEELEEAAAHSHKNFEIMREAGVDCIPVFHQGEAFKWLERMLDQRIPYIGISPYSNAAEGSVLRWLDHVFTRITDKEGRPLCKTHCFGFTSKRIVCRYPWFSLDSTTWARSAAYGNVLLPRFTQMGPDYTHRKQFRMSERDWGGGESLLAIPPWGRKRVDDYFGSLGMSFAEVCKFHKARLRVNAAYYRGLEAQLEVAPFPPSRRVGGSKPRLYSRHAAAEFNYAPKLFLATILNNHQQAIVLTRLKIKHRLISFYHCGSSDADQIDEYTRKGVCERTAEN